MSMYAFHNLGHLLASTYKSYYELADVNVNIP